MFVVGSFVTELTCVKCWAPVDVDDESSQPPVVCPSCHCVMDVVFDDELGWFRLQCRPEEAPKPQLSTTISRRVLNWFKLR